MQLSLRVPLAFVLMPFSTAFDDIYERGIKRACDEAGIDCLRVDKQLFTGNIMDRLYGEIARADLIIADLTGQNANVFYEVGYARALKKRMILLSRDKELVFDLGHDAHIPYAHDVDKLRDKLRDHLKAALGSAPKPTLPPVQVDVVLINKRDARCLDVELSSEKTWKVQQWPFHGGENQLWRILPAGGGYFRITSVANQNCLSADNDGQAAGTPVIHWKYHATPSQQWQFRVLNDHTHLIINKASEKCLGIENPKAPSDGSRAVLSEGQAAAYQKWWFLAPVTAGTQ